MFELYLLCGSLLNEIEFRNLRHVFSNFIRRVLGAEKIPVPSRRSAFVCLTFEDLSDHLSKLDEITYGCEAVELRVDHLSSFSSDFVTKQISLLRAATKSLPIVFTVRTVSQGGNSKMMIMIYLNHC